MSSKSCYSRADKVRISVAGLALAAMIAAMPQAFAGDAPAWLHTAASVPLPAQSEKTEAVVIYSEQVVTAQSPERVRRLVRVGYKILRPGGRELGTVAIPFNSRSKITNLHGWCIPAQGRDYEVKQKDAAEISLPKIEGSELISDVKMKALQIPAADPGSVIGYEYEEEDQPYVLQDVWFFQGPHPVREAHYTLQLPSGWEFKASFLHAPEVKPVPSGNQWQWTVRDQKAIEHEEQMPPWRALAGQMVISFYPPGGEAGGRSFSTWNQMAAWYETLAQGRREASPEIKQKVAELTAQATTPLARMTAIAHFVQQDVRYVAIELGIGGWQPHFAAEVFRNRYGDCKDKATLMSSMLAQAGIESYYVVINSERGMAAPDTPAYRAAFDHMIVAIKLPEGVPADSLYATVQHAKLGKLLFFDPTSMLTPFGQIGGYLQENYGLLVTPGGGELVLLPSQPTSMNGIQRTGKLTLDAAGTLQGDVEEKRLGDRAWEQRRALRNVTSNADRIKPLETMLSHSLGTFQISKASLTNLTHTDQPFGYEYSFLARNYAKSAGNLLLVRPRVLGNKSSGLLETREPRHFPVEFESPTRDTDVFEITLPPGFEVDDLPQKVDAEFSFGSYHSRSELQGNVLRYSRTLELKELSVPLSGIEDLRKFYRIIADDERQTAVLKPVGTH